MKNVKTRIIAMVCMMIALFISFTPLTVMAAQPLDEILDYTIQVDMRNDGTMDIAYHIEWKVLDDKSEGPLSWVKIGIPNKNVDEIEALCIERAKQLFGAEFANVQPHSGAQANMAVELATVDPVEAVNQALGEFADKLDRVNLTPVFRHPEKAVTMVADGKHLWRGLSNLLNNAVKYAMPNTRLYVDLMELDGNAVIAIKNISREQLNVNAEELMERFVRGDASRNTEGSGLGLNIARSLAELQGGQMHLTVDGDLFKVTLIFPLA